LFFVLTQRIIGICNVIQARYG